MSDTARSCSVTESVRGDDDGRRHILVSKRKVQALYDKERGDEWSVRRTGLALPEAAGVQVCPVSSGTSRPIGTARQKACRAADRGLWRLELQYLHLYLLGRGILVFSLIRVSLFVTCPSTI